MEPPVIYALAAAALLLLALGALVIARRRGRDRAPGAAGDAGGASAEAAADQASMAPLPPEEIAAAPPRTLAATATSVAAFAEELGVRYFEDANDVASAWLLTEPYYRGEAPRTMRMINGLAGEDRARVRVAEVTVRVGKRDEAQGVAIGNLFVIVPTILVVPKGTPVALAHPKVPIDPVFDARFDVRSEDAEAARELVSGRRRALFLARAPLRWQVSEGLIVAWLPRAPTVADYVELADAIIGFHAALRSGAPAAEE